MQVAVVGTGNVGATLLHGLAPLTSIERIWVMSRRKESALAAIMDVASANPAGALKIRFAPYERLVEADVVVLAAGAQMKKGQHPSELLEENLLITSSILSCSELKSSAVVIAVATPVDDITPLIQAKTGLSTKQVMGFGGDLDFCRLEYVLREAGLNTPPKEIIGEHGRNAIPLFSGDKDYSEVAGKVQDFLSTITSYAGSPRNLASGFLLTELIRSIAEDTRRVHRVCGFHPQYNIYLTWPFAIGLRGVGEAKVVEVSGQALDDLEKLMSDRNKGAPYV